MSEFTHFKDRQDAGCQLARQLAHYAHNDHAVVLALPRGGVPVGYEVAARLGLPLDVLIVRKLGVPGQEEFAMGAIAGGGVRILHKAVMARLHISPAIVQEVIDREADLIRQREQLYRDSQPPQRLDGRIVILVDDGLATGATVRVAIEAIRKCKPARVVVAVPVAAPDARDAIAAEVDEMVCLAAPGLFRAVSEWYGEFGQTSDAEVQALLARSRHPDRQEAEREAEVATQFTR
ncbi:MAG: phosphoribosyltransferase [Telluria sp.]